MKWIAALLMVVNVAIYLSAGSPSSDHGRPAMVDEMEVNLEGMLLLHEIPADGSGLLESEVGDGEIVALKDSDGDAEVANVEAGMLVCHRIGPFKAEQELSIVTAWLGEQNIGFRQVASHTRELKAMRVFLGPFRGQAEVDTAMSRLKENALDSYTFKGEDGMIRIFLGYFTQDGLADKFIDHLLKIGIEAKTAPVFRKLGPYTWIETELGSKDRQALASLSWLKNGSEIAMSDC